MKKCENEHSEEFNEIENNFLIAKAELDRKLEEIYTIERKQLQDQNFELEKRRLKNENKRIENEKIIIEMNKKKELKNEELKQDFAKYESELKKKLKILDNENAEKIKT